MRMTTKLSLRHRLASAWDMVRAHANALPALLWKAMTRRRVAAGIINGMVSGPARAVFGLAAMFLLYTFVWSPASQAPAIQIYAETVHINTPSSAVQSRGPAQTERQRGNERVALFDNRWPQELSGGLSGSGKQDRLTSGQSGAALAQNDEWGDIVTRDGDEWGDVTTGDHKAWGDKRSGSPGRRNRSDTGRRSERERIVVAGNDRQGGTVYSGYQPGTVHGGLDKGTVYGGYNAGYDSGSFDYGSADLSPVKPSHGGAVTAPKPAKPAKHKGAASVPRDDNAPAGGAMIQLARDTYSYDTFTPDPAAKPRV